jgi:hypothetical protein
LVRADAGHHLVVRLVSPRITLFAYGTAIVETLLALASLAGFARKFTYVGGAVYSLLVWRRRRDSKGRTRVEQRHRGSSTPWCSSRSW